MLSPYILKQIQWKQHWIWHLMSNSLLAVVTFAYRCKGRWRANSFSALLKTQLSNGPYYESSILIMWVTVCTWELPTARTSSWSEACWATGSGKLSIRYWWLCTLSVREEPCTFYVRSEVITILCATVCWQSLKDSGWIKIKDEHAILSAKYCTNITTTHWSTCTCDLAAIEWEDWTYKIYRQYCFLFYSKIFFWQSMYGN